MPESPVRPLAVICAIEEELVHLRAALDPATPAVRQGRHYMVANQDGYPLVLALCGIGMLSAAAITEACILHWNPVAVFNYGCSGAHRDDLLPGDIIIGARTVAYDNIRVEVDGSERYARMHYRRNGKEERADYLPADPLALEAARRAAVQMHGTHVAWNPGAPRTPQVCEGTVASADRWNRHRDRIAALALQHGSYCEDMEAAAIALTCASHDCPFLTIKDISNNELLEYTDTATFMQVTAGELGRRAAALVLETIRVYRTLADERGAKQAKDG